MSDMRTFTVGGQRCVIADARCWRGTCSLVVSMIELYVLVIVGLVMAAWAAWWVADGWQRRLVLLEVRARDLGAAAALVVDATRCLVARTQVMEPAAVSMQPIALAPEPIAVAQPSSVSSC